MARPNIPSGPHGLGFFGTNVQSGVNSPARPNVEDV